MQTKESEKSKPESRIFRTTGANSPGRKHRKSFIALWLIAVCRFTSAGAQDANKGKREPLIIQEQGGFAVGGSVTTTSGTFDPMRSTPPEPIPRGRRYTATTLTSSIRSR